MKQTIQPHDLVRLKFINDAHMSQDGKSIVYTITHVDEKSEEEFSAIWIQSVETGEKRQLTAGDAYDSSPQFSPDGHQIAFMSTRGGKPQIYTVFIKSGDVHPVTDMVQGVSSGPVWSPDGTTIAFGAGPPADGDFDPSKPYRVTRAVYRFDAIGYLDSTVEDIYVITIEDGQTRQLTNDGLMNRQPRWSPNGREILYEATMDPDRFDCIFPWLRIVDMDAQVRDILGEWGTGSDATWLPDGKRVAFIGRPNEDGWKNWSSKSDLWVVDTQGGQPECRTAGLEVGIGSILQPDLPNIVLMAKHQILIPDGQMAFVNIQVGGITPIYRIALSGDESFESIVGGNRSCVPLAINQDMLMYAASEINNPADLFVSDIDGNNERLLTEVNASVLSEFHLPEIEQLLFPGTDGKQVEGWLLKPPGCEAPYPTVLYIHGGPQSGFGHMYSFDHQMLTGAGYAVLLINYRNSTGYGSEFSSETRGDLGNLDYQDLMVGLDHIIGRGLADPDRLGVCGLSAGGNMSSWIVGQTDRFKAAVPENPVTNWRTMYGCSDIGVWFSVALLGGHPHEIPDIYSKCSPITHAHKCTTPTLLIQCEDDFRCPAEQSEQFYTVLKANGCIVEMLRIPAHSHVGAINGKPIARRAQNEALLGWMNKYVLGIETEGEYAS